MIDLQRELPAERTGSCKTLAGQGVHIHSGGGFLYSPQFGLSGPGSGPLCVIKSNSAAETHPRIAGSIALFVESPAKAMENRDRVALWVCKPFPPGRSGSRSLTTATDSRSLSGATGATALKGGLLE